MCGVLFYHKLINLSLLSPPLQRVRESTKNCSEREEKNRYVKSERERERERERGGGEREKCIRVEMSGIHR